MTTTLLIARHGNTFASCDTVCRVGSGTNLPLVESGLKQGDMLGLYLRENNIKLASIYSGPLLRAQQTARNALKTSGQNLPIIVADTFNEINYGPDEGKPEAQVIARLGQDALTLWDSQAIVPDGWIVDPDEIIKGWKKFGAYIAEEYKDQTILVVTSNGTARFAPHLTGDFEAFRSEHTMKLSTGAISSMTYNEEENNWSVNYWNTKPKTWLEDHNISPDAV